MRSLLGFLCTFSLFISTGYALSCNQCIGIGTKACEGGSITCPSDNICGTQYSVNYQHGVKLSETLIRSCIPRNQCGMKGSFTVMQELKIVSGMSCCYTDNCTPPEPTLPQVSTQKNGLVCRSCISINSDSCDPSATVECTGIEDMCYLQNTELEGTMSLKTINRGCITKNICELGDQSISAHGMNMKSTLTCTSGSAALYSGFFLAITVALFFTKLLC
ncbi:phospholipase A2 inhibitor and Ly6/PLAUR domain-containing protein-like [Pelobates fuscus]|uniref:phospholipase A2 inhibitor and Ly6/PLAUR domain-containing protein-like n=1 Tax=Pelobates fuscus TaxID=191477 RepID=UPI002FE49004